MYRLVTHQEIALAQSSMSALRHAVAKTPKGSVGPQARDQLRVLAAQVNAAGIAIDVLRSDLHNPSAKSLVTEYERLEKAAHDIVDDLSTAAEYKGKRRAAMTTAEKSRFISEHGVEKFFSLPR